MGQRRWTPWLQLDRSSTCSGRSKLRIGKGEGGRLLHIRSRLEEDWFHPSGGSDQTTGIDKEYGGMSVTTV